MSVPRLVVAAPASGHGKTTLATGLMAALARRGLAVSGHKVGPDYIDPGYHALATGRPGRNLDPHLVGEERIAPLFAHGAQTPQPADVAVVEGVMGLFDGQIGGDGFASTAHVARLLQAPIVLVVDISSASRTVAAMVRGLAGYDPRVRIAGVILNKAGSPRHAAEVRAAVEDARDGRGLPVLGVLGRDDGVVAPSRHLGLVPAAERDDAAAALDQLVAQVERRIDLDEILRIARSAPELDVEPWSPRAALAEAAEAESAGPESAAAIPDGAESRTAAPRVAVAGGRAFTFTYAETVELLEAAGCEVVTFDPTRSERLPDGVQGVYLGGGFPEVHSAALGRNEALLADLRAAVEAGVPTVAECAGLLYLARSLDHAPMVGVLPADAAMSPRLTLAYRTAHSPRATLLGRPGEAVTGHEFHRSRLDPPAPADLESTDPESTARDSADPETAPEAPGAWAPAWRLEATAHHPQAPAGYAHATLHASYLHVHWAGHPRLAQRFVAAARAAVPFTAPHPSAPHPSAPGRPGGERRAPAPSITAAPADPLRHHGDRETRADDGSPLDDFAVNTFEGAPPSWLSEALHRSIDESGRYPDARRLAAAERSVARRHSRDEAEVLAVAGVAEAFTLIARSARWRCPVVVHPQFTEPDVALRTAGSPPHHVVLRAEDGFALDPAQVPEQADLVVVGNPTNPTGRLHPAAALRALCRPGRTVVVDEAFMDALPASTAALADAPTPGLLVLRSLTKLWGIPGVRAGYALGEPALLARLREQQTPWSVSAAALAALAACSTPEARAEEQRRADQLASWRSVLARGLEELGVPQAPGSAPFVLARPGPGVHARLREQGFAVRRCDTFPGLDAGWVRIAARPPQRTRALLMALQTAMA